MHRIKTRWKLHKNAEFCFAQILDENPDFLKFIFLEINYFVGTGCILFLRNIDKLFF